MAQNVADQRARQGGRGRPVLFILIGSMLLLGVYMITLMTWSGSETPTSPQQAASQKSTNSGASSANSARVPSENPAYPSPSTPASGTAGSAPASR